MAEKDENLVTMENELFVKQVTKRGIGQGNRGDHPATEIASTTSKVSISIHEEAIKTSSREKRLKTFREAAAKESQPKLAHNQDSKQKIQRVPFMLRDHRNFDKYYEPRVAALGPFHHGKPTYEPAENVKLKLAVNFVTDSKQNDEDLLRKIEENIKQLRECYEEEATKDYDDEALAWMMFVDGCSTLELIYKYDNLEEFKIKRDQVAFLEQDVFLLENQLPYLVLKLLISSSNKHEELNKSIKNFVHMHGVAPDQKPSDQALNRNQQSTGQQEHTISMEKDQEPAHLLDMLRTMAEPGFEFHPG